MDNASLFAISCGAALAAVLAWRKRRSFKRLKSMLADLWHALPRFWPIMKIRKVKWRWRRKLGHKEAPRDSDIEEVPDDEPPEERQQSA